MNCLRDTLIHQRQSQRLLFGMLFELIFVRWPNPSVSVLEFGHVDVAVPDHGVGDCLTIFLAELVNLSAQCRPHLLTFSAHTYDSKYILNTNDFRIDGLSGAVCHIEEPDVHRLSVEIGLMTNVRKS